MTLPKVVLILTRQERTTSHKVASEGNTTRQIAQAAHVSLLDIGKIVRWYTGEETGYQNKSPSITSKAFQMFKENKSRVKVSIAMNLDAVVNVLNLQFDFVVIV